VSQTLGSEELIRPCAYFWITLRTNARGAPDGQVVLGRAKVGAGSDQRWRLIATIATRPAADSVIAHSRIAFSLARWHRRRQKHVSDHLSVSK
jgi:hypothetical protein